MQLKTRSKRLLVSVAPDPVGVACDGEISGGLVNGASMDRRSRHVEVGQQGDDGEPVGKPSRFFHDALFFGDNPDSSDDRASRRRTGRSARASPGPSAPATRALAPVTAPRPCPGHRNRQNLQSRRSFPARQFEAADRSRPVASVERGEHSEGGGAGSQLPDRAQAIGPATSRRAVEVALRVTQDSPDRVCPVAPLKEASAVMVDLPAASSKTVPVP